jgi:hypothetical protein
MDNSNSASSGFVDYFHRTGCWLLRSSYTFVLKPSPAKIFERHTASSASLRHTNKLVVSAGREAFQ